MAVPLQTSAQLLPGAAQLLPGAAHLRALSGQYLTATQPISPRQRFDNFQAAPGRNAHAPAAEFSVCA